MKYMKEFINSFSGKPVVEINDIKRFLKYRNANGNYYKIFITNLIKSKKLLRITRGAYTFYPEIEYVGFAFYPFYYGLEEALSLYGLWDQETNPVIITPRKVRNGIRQFQERNYIVKWIDRKMFFGYKYIKYDKFYIPVSDIEKTFIDLVYFKVHMYNDVMENLKEKINMKTLNEYLLRSPENIKKIVSYKLNKK